MPMPFRSIGMLLMFGFLTACGGGSPVPGATTAKVSPAPDYATPLPYPPETPVLDGVPLVDENWRDWLVANHHRIASLDIHEPDDSDLDFLQAAIGSRRIVLLGESSHRVDEFDQAKARVIRYLHERMGFDVLVFEANIYSCFRANEQLLAMSPDDAMHDSIYPIWDCAATLDLFTYLKQTQTSADPMVLAGMDIQESRNNSAVGDSPDQLYALIAPLDPTYAESVRTMELSLIRNYHSDGWLSVHASELNAEYGALSDWLDAHMDALIAANPQRPLWPRIARRLAWGRRQEMFEIQAGSSTRQGAEYRDQGMAANVETLLALYPGKKIIIWAHNAHIQKSGATVGAASISMPPFRDTGELLMADHAPDMYAIGLYMLRGITEDLAGREMSVRRPLEGSLEALLYAARRKAGFVDLLGAAKEPGTAWMDQTTPTLDWGAWPQLMVPRDQYDGILWVDTVHPPVYQ